MTLSLTEKSQEMSLFPHTNYDLHVVFKTLTFMWLHRIHTMTQCISLRTRYNVPSRDHGLRIRSLVKRTQSYDLDVWAWHALTARHMLPCTVLPQVWRRLHVSRHPAVRTFQMSVFAKGGVVFQKGIITMSGGNHKALPGTPWHTFTIQHSQKAVNTHTPGHSVPCSPHDTILLSQYTAIYTSAHRLPGKHLNKCLKILLLNVYRKINDLKT